VAGSKSDYLEAKVKNETLGAVAYSAPTPLYVGLWTSALSDSSHGGTAGEVSGGSYSRLSLTNNTTNFATVTTAAKVNSTAWTFTQATASWGTVSYVGIFDGNAGTSGDNLLLWADLTTAKAIGSGDTAVFNAGDFSWTED
jgi:hypothetical protein